MRYAMYSKQASSIQHEEKEVKRGTFRIEWNSVKETVRLDDTVLKEESTIKEMERMRENKNEHEWGIRMVCLTYCSYCYANENEKKKKTERREEKTE